MGIVTSLEILVIEMGNRVSKSIIYISIIVKEQRVDGSSISLRLDIVRYTLVAGKSGSWYKLKKSRLKISQ